MFIIINFSRDVKLAFTLTLLGTDTQFSPGKVPNAYDVVESLSYLATKIQVDKPLAMDSVTQYRNQNVAVVNGPTTMGAEVGDRIARGVEAILEAISRGETNINIMAHSRGAVEAILVAHELQRIQDLFKNKNPVVLTELTDSVCAYTKPAMRGAPHKTAYEALNLEQIAAHIGKAKISILNIDPVPGGNYMGITRATTLAWKDPRFYRVPPIVTEYEQYVYENERTRCFKPIVPKCDSPATHFTLASLPGHHGTGSGNLLDQQRTPNDQLLTGDVQKLVIAKGVDFLTRNDVNVTPPSDAEDPFTVMLSPLFEGTKIIKKKLHALYFGLYDSIIENREDYRHFNKTAYATLGKENDWAKLIWTIPEQRIIHHYAHNDTFLETVIPPVPGGTFLNYEHARLYLNDKLKLNGELSLGDTISHSIDALIKMCDHAKKPRVNEVQAMSASFSADRLAPVANDDKTINLLLSGLSMLIDEVKRPYLLGELRNNAEREKIYAEMKKLFTFFNKKQESVLGTVIGDSLHSNLHLTLETKRMTLESEYQALSKKLQKNVFFDEFCKEFKQLITNIEHSNLKDSELHNKLKLLLDEANRVPPTYQSIKAFLESKHRLLGQEDANETVTLARLLVAEALDDSVSSAPYQILKEVIELHKELKYFRKSLPDFKALYAELDYDLWTRLLEGQSDRVISLAGQYCTNEKLQLEAEVKPLFRDNGLLYLQIAGLAVASGAEDPLVPKLKEAERQIVRLEEQNNLLTREKVQLGQRIHSLELDIGELTRAKERLVKDKADLTEEKTQLKSKISELAREQELLRQQLARATERFESEKFNLTVQKEQLGQQLELRIDGLTQAKDGLEKDKVALTEAKAQLESIISNLTRAKEELEKDKVVLIEATAQLKLQLELQISQLTEEKAKLVSDNGLLGEQIAELELDTDVRVRNLQDEVDRLKQENNAQSDILNSEAELQCQLLVKMKLIPLTVNYLKYLAATIKKSSVPGLVISEDITALITAVKQINNWPENNTSSEQLKQKFEKVAELYEGLTTKNNLKPSENVTKFYETLNKADKDIGIHRDSKWKRYTANTIAVLGIILTGVLPGLAVLAIVSAVRGKSAKFWQSEGQGFFDKSKNEVEDNPYSAAYLPKNGG